MTAYKQKVVIGDAVLYLGDCMDILPTLGKVDTAAKVCIILFVKWCNTRH